MSKFFLSPAAIAALLICAITSNLQAAHRVEVRLNSLTRYLSRYAGPPQRLNPYVVTVVANLRTGEVNSGVTTTFSNLRLGETRVNPTSDGLVSMTVENQSELYVLNILMDQMNEQRREHGRLRDWVHRSVQFTLQARSQDWSSGRIPTSTLIREITDRVLAGIDLPVDRRLGYSHDGFGNIMPQPGAVPIDVTLVNIRSNYHIGGTFHVVATRTTREASPGDGGAYGDPLRGLFPDTPQGGGLQGSGPGGGGPLTFGGGSPGSGSDDGQPGWGTDGSQGGGLFDDPRPSFPTVEGTWSSNIGLNYVFSNTSTGFRWETTDFFGRPQVGQGRFLPNNRFEASWYDDLGNLQGRTMGTVGFDAGNRAVSLRANNGVRFSFVGRD